MHYDFRIYKKSRKKKHQRKWESNEEKVHKRVISSTFDKRNITEFQIQQEVFEDSFLYVYL